MVSRLALLLLALSINPLNAAELNVGGTEISASVPPGFALLTPDIQPMHAVSLDMLSANNVRLATFVDEKIIPAALAGEMPTFERYINVESERNLVSLSLTAKDFSEFRQITHNRLEQAIRKMEQAMPDAMSGMSDRVGETLDRDVALSISNVVPLPIHFESDQTVSNSMITKYEMNDGGVLRQHIVTVTSSFVLVKGKLIFVYVYGGPNDLEWTRAMSKEWIGNLLTANETATVGSTSSSSNRSNASFDWNPILGKAFGGALLGGLFALFVALLGWIGRLLKKAGTPKNDDVLDQHWR